MDVIKAGVAICAVALWGCADKHLPNTDVTDTPEHRRIVSFCETYRKAVERKDVTTLVSMASPDYYEEGRNLDASDDIDYAALRDFLTRKFAEANNIRYEVRYRRITVDRKKCLEKDKDKKDISCNRVLIDYTYSGSYRVASSEGDKYKSPVEENRLELVANGDSYLIITGM
jgi:hypothetical protein